VPTDKPAAIDREIVARLLNAATPERSTDLQDLWAKYDPAFILEEDGRGLTFRAGKDRIIFSAKTLEHDWTIAFAAWRTFRAYGPIILVAGFLTKPLSPEMMRDDVDLPAEEASSDELLYFARELRRAESADEVGRPSGIPEPAPNIVGFSIEDQATFNLLCIATSATFLHEIRHLRYFKDGDIPAIRREEEIRCDEYAREFLTTRCREYARTVGKPTAAVLNFRTMGMALAAYIIHEATPFDDQAGSNDYPSSSERFIALVGAPDLSDDADCWIFASALLLSILKRTSRFKTPVAFVNAKELFLSLCSKLPNRHSSDHER
jgi:hypothetical protein